jgi:hypothetical protein
MCELWAWARESGGKAAQSDLIGFVVLLVCATEPFLQAFAAKPNIIFILTDDQDLVLDSESATPTINKLIRDAGASVETGIVS